MPHAANKTQHSQIDFFFLKSLHCTHVLSYRPRFCPDRVSRPLSGPPVHLPLGEGAHSSSPVPGHSGCCQSSAIVNEVWSVRLSPRDRNPRRRGLTPGPRTAPARRSHPREKGASVCAPEQAPTSRALHTQLTPGHGESRPSSLDSARPSPGGSISPGSSQQQGVPEAAGGSRPTDTVSTGCADTACLEQPSVVVRKA